MVEMSKAKVIEVIKWFFLLAIIITASLLINSDCASAGEIGKERVFRAGAAASNITPPLGGAAGDAYT